jgi:serine/threonine-protein kinase
VLDRKQSVKMVDFGMVKILQSEAKKGGRFETSIGTSIGTAGYMAPEQVTGGKIDGRSDLFALGVLLYELLSGKKPFPTTNLLAYFHALNLEDPAPLTGLVPGLPSDIDAVVARLLAKPPEQRYQTAQEAVRELERCLPR